METNYPLKLWIYTFCYNEEKILPYVIEYWKQYATKVIVYDNRSTDNSLKILSQYSWIEVREFDTENIFDPEKISQYKSFCYVNAIGKADYVMVCDIDEVLLPTENLFPELVLAKKDNVQLFQTKYYEIINNDLNPKYDSLIHTAEDYYAYPNANIHKAIVFDPQIKISFGYNSLTYSTNKNYKTESIVTFHLKLFNSNIFVERQKHLISRLNNNQDLYYGNDKNLGTRLSYFKLLFPYKYKFNKNENYITISNDVFSISNSSFNDMVWMPTLINHNTNSNNKNCIIGIPIYKEQLNDNEKASLNQICSVIKDSYEICLICPEDISLVEYNTIAEKNNVKLSTLYCAKQYFIGTKEYSFMLETTDFYKCFSEYQYLMIYQLDGWIFKNDLQKFIEFDYDYYGSPWKLGSFGFNDDAVGNGGVSLRKVSKFIEVCQKFEPDDFKKQYVDKEDLFFCKTMQSKIELKKAPVRISAGFAITSNPPYFRYKYIDKQLPMCVHAFDKYMEFWVNDIKIEKEDNKENKGTAETKLEKHDYKTRLELIKMRLNKTSNMPEQINNQTIKNREQEEKRKMGNSYQDFLKAYFGSKTTKNQEEKKKAVVIKPQVIAKSNVPVKQEEKKIEIKQNNSKNNILICIFNYKHDENAKRWLNLLSTHFETYVLDSGNDKKVNEFIQFPNIYYSGLFNEFKKLFNKKQYIFGGIICSDVVIDDNNISKFINRVKWLSTTKNVGIWQAAADESSRSIHGHVTKDTSIQYKICIEGWLIFMKNEIINNLPFITQDNKFGWNIDTVSEYISYKLNLLNIIDNNCVVHHPAERGYSETIAREQGQQWQKRVLKELSVQIQKNVKYDNIKYNSDITFIIVNRDGNNISTVIQNFNNTFNQYFNKIDFIVIEQCDKNLFMRGQLYNIGVKYTNTEYIALIDNDIYNLDSFDIIDLYSNLGPYVAFNKIAQITLNNKTYNKISSELRTAGWGAFSIMKKTDFEKCNGFSNLCFGWGAEDNILNEKIHFARYAHELGHITHPRRNNLNPESTTNNRKILKLYEQHKILFDKDGYNQTIFDIVYNKKENNILYLGVNNISVDSTYVYKSEYQNAIKIAKIQFSNKEKIIITMTSWKKRITNVKRILFDIITYQLKKPDLCVINLSSEEFPNKENDLPIELLDLIKSSLIRIEINWIDGPNIKQWKKILPTLQKYPNDVIICIDDDFIYPNDLISTFYNKHLEFPNNPISGNTVRMFGVKCHCGCASLVKNEYFTNIQQYIKDAKLYNFYSSDIFFTYVAEKSKHPYIYVGKQFFTNMKSYQENDALSKQVHNGAGIRDTWNYLIKTYGKI